MIGMTNEQFQEFLQTALDDLRVKQEKLDAAYGITACVRWDLDEAAEKLKLVGRDGQLRVEADVVDVGSFAASSSSWMWGWANESYPASVREKAAVLKELAISTGFGLFASGSAIAVKDESMAWELAALSVRHLGALGVYKAPSPSRPTAAFFAILSARKCTP